ncbi:MAG: NAD(P)/FAD-dependent oxidoreductase [Spirochaetales bacterium]|nr:NAD(P)/FAD-dependent oxidoreductase [Spirochaetales bacterium]
MHTHTVIVGNGISGITAAREIRKRSDNRITVISEESPYFFSRPALMYIFMGHMKVEHTYPYEKFFWKKNRIELLEDKVESIDKDARKLILSRSGPLSYDQLILATGSRSNRFNWPGQDLKGVQTFYSLQDLEMLENNVAGVKRAVIVGGGLIGVEMAEMLLSRAIEVTFLVREKNFWDIVLPVDEARMIESEIQHHGIDLRLQTELQQILPDDAGRVRAITTSTGETMECQLVALTVGVSPRTDLARAALLDVGRGILVDRFLQTSDPHIFAAGDCAEFREPLPGRRAVEQVWYTGKLQAEALARTLTGEPTVYDPGVWFNSAKFFDLEYQVYGDVPPQKGVDQADFLWQQGNRLIRITYHSLTHTVTGIHSIGMRLRQEICVSWIKEGRSVDFVIENLPAALFDPEFYNNPAGDIARSFRHREVIHV